MIRAVIAVVLALLLGACAMPLPTETSESRDIGFIRGFNTDDPRISMPDSVARGASFDVTVVSYGNGCVSRHSTQLLLQPSGATVIPFDATKRHFACPDILLSLEHRATLHFQTPGERRIVFRGRTLPDSTIISVERTVTVY
jgi:hypothetical protein